jgi:putative oxidoreductase
MAGAVLLWRNDWMATVACLALVGFLIPATIIAHGFWSAPSEVYGAQLVNFLKNLSMIGGLLAVGALYWRSR